MLASTCLAVLFVPSFYVVMQRIEDWRSGKTKSAAKAAKPETVTERVG
jgi:hydrophobic/amphiphilic exporter-1 (mainly G- bacteria), HAE1 family